MNRSLRHHLTLLLVCCASIPLIAQEVSIPSNVQAQQRNLPDTVRYAVIFHQVAAFKDKADALDSQGLDGSPYRHHLTHKFNLTPQQLIYLNTVALEFREEEKEVNEEIKQSVIRFRDMNGQLPRGATTMPPPSEAAYLIAKRAAVVARARDRFHGMVGDAEFTRIDERVKSQMAVQGGQHDQ